MQSKSGNEKSNKKSNNKKGGLVKSNNSSQSIFENYINEGNRLPIESKRVSSNRFNIVEIQKFHDAQGTSYRNKDDVQNYRTNKNTIDKTSKFGVNPAVYYDSSVDYKKPHDQVTYVKPYDDKYLLNAASNAISSAKRLSKEAVEEYRDEITRSKVLTKKNLAIAKVDALRILTKAIILEKNYYERESELARHKEAINEINQLRKQLIEKNDVDLEYKLAKLARANEIELKNNEDDYIRTKVKIEQKAEIIDLKIQNEKEKIRALSRGEGFRKHSMRDEVKMIKNRKHIPAEAGLYDDIDAITSIIKKIKNMDMKKLDREERDSIVKFLRLVEAYEKAERHTELVQRYEDALCELDRKINKTIRARNRAKKRIGREFTVVSYDTYRKVVNAKKESLFISEPVKNFEQPEVRTKVIKMKAPGKVDPTKARQSLSKLGDESIRFEKMQPQRMDATQFYKDRDIERTIKKFRKVVNNVLHNDDFTVSPYGDNAYKIKYQKMIYTKYEFQLKQKRDKKIKGSDDYFKDIVGDSSEASSERKKWWARREPKEKTPGYVKRLIRKLETLPSDPVVVKHNGSFRSEDRNLMETIRKLHDLEVNNQWSEIESQRTIREARELLYIYDRLVKEDARSRINVMKAQVADEKLTDYMVKAEKRIASKYAKADTVLQAKNAKTEQKYQRKVENVKNDAMLNAEYIYEQEQKSLAKEEEQHLLNQSVSKEINNKIANQQYKYQNQVITNIVKEVQKYNKKAIKPIPLTDIPQKILSLPLTSDARIDINLKKTNSNVIAIANSSDRRFEIVSKVVNRDVPNNVHKIYVLDKFRNVKDVKMRVAMLNEYASLMYSNAIKFNESREKKEIEMAEKRLNKKLALVNSMYDDANKLKQVANRMEHIVDERNFVQNQYVQIKKEKWKIYDKDVKIKEKMLRLKKKEEELEMLKAEKEANRNKKQYAKLIKRNKDGSNIDYKDIIGEN